MHRYFSILQKARVKHLLSTRQAVILDVRDQNEFQKSHLKNAISIPLQSLLKDFSTLDDLASLKITDGDWVLVHCQLSLIRGPQAAAHLDRIMGKKFKVGLIEGGFKALSDDDDFEKTQR